MTKVRDLHRKWMKEPDYRLAYEGLADEFDVARAMIEARTSAGLSQSQLARRTKTSQSYIARIESGKVRVGARNPAGLILNSPADEGPGEGECMPGPAGCRLVA